MRLVLVLGLCVVAAGVLVAGARIAVPGIFDHGDATAGDDRRLGAIASAIAHRPVSVECRDPARFESVAESISAGGLKGFVAMLPDGRPEAKAYLSPDVCRALHGSLEPGAFPDLATPQGLRLVLAVTTLAHESWHLAGVTDEATTQCYGLQTTRYVAIRLGAPPAEAQLLAEVAFRAYESPAMGVYYAPNCRPGGLLDLSPGDGRWP